ncbi:MAG: hypothetical protein HY660_16645 [Armatimonadetes bacterium]|nr:hypothetical protein [Armatimonadota bacterium]
MRRLLTERNFILVLSVLIAVSMWLYVVATQTPTGLAVREDAQTRIVPVVPTLVGRPAEGYTVGTIQVFPTAVSITGPPALIERVTGVQTRPVSVDGTQSDVVRQVSLQLPPSVRGNEGDVQVVIRVVAALVATIMRGVPVQVSDVGEGLRVEMEPQTVDVQVQGGQAVVLRLRPSDLTAVASVARLGPGRHRLPLTVRAPEGVTVISTIPSTVQVVLKEP